MCKSARLGIVVKYISRRCSENITSDPTRLIGRDVTILVTAKSAVAATVFVDNLMVAYPFWVYHQQPEIKYENQWLFEINFDLKGKFRFWTFFVQNDVVTYNFKLCTILRAIAIFEFVP